MECGGSCPSVGDKQYEMLRYMCVMVGDVFEVSGRQVLRCGRCGLHWVWGWVCCNTCCGASLCCIFEMAGVVLGQARGVVLAGFWTGVCAVVSSHLT